MAMNEATRWQQVKALKAKGEKDWVLRSAVLVAVLLCAASWLLLDLELVHPVTQESRFVLKTEILEDFLPYTMREKQADGTREFVWDSSKLGAWFEGTWESVGWRGVLDTIGISVLAMVLAALIGLPFVLPASRTITLEGGFLPADRVMGAGERILRQVLFFIVRSILILFRAIPEYLWAFLLLILFGPAPIAAIIALALHNAGILAKLTSESVEDMDQKPLVALAGLGGKMGPVALLGAMPRAFRQFLVYFFYRWETCIRETAILGILAIHTIGLHIEQSFAFFHYDKALLLILINSVVVIMGDLLGTWGRRVVRQV